MRIVVSGTHAIGKSTLIGDFAASHPEYEVLPDPFELVDTAADEPDASTYLAQLRLSADRLVELSPADRVIAERGPLDFLAYLAAMDHLRRIRLQEEVRIRAAALIAQAMCAVDLLVVLPATGYDDFRAPEDEDPELRQAMNDALLDLVDDSDLLAGTTLVEIAGPTSSRLNRVEEALRNRERFRPRR